jgi:hypothetical protein
MSERDDLVAEIQQLRSDLEKSNALCAERFSQGLALAEYVSERDHGDMNGWRECELTPCSMFREMLMSPNAGAPLLAELTRLRAVEQAGDELANSGFHGDHCALAEVNNSSHEPRECTCGFTKARAVYQAAKGAK